MLLSFSSIMISVPNPSLEISYYALQFLILYHITYLQTFHISIIARGIQIRLELIFKEFKDFNFKNNSKRFFHFEQSLLLLHDANYLSNKCLKFSRFCNFMQAYFAILTNLYWVGMALCGLYSANLAGEKWQIDRRFNFLTMILSDGLVILIPAMLILTIPACIQYQIQKTNNKIISVAASLKTFSFTEDFLMMMKHLKYKNESFGVMDTSFATLGRVRLRKNQSVFIFSLHFRCLLQSWVFLWFFFNLKSWMLELEPLRNFNSPVKWSFK